jgi:hypothetical protein
VSEQAAPVRIRYRNWRGETALRRIVPEHVWFGSTEWHPDAQWFLRAVDTDKAAVRDFALRDVLQWDVSADETA